MTSGHQIHMQMALDRAKAARDADEVPVGAVVVVGGQVFAAQNQVIARSDPTAHAEILAIRQAAAGVGNYRLSGGVLYSTIEPCLMCMATVIHARLACVVYGAPDPRWGGAGSLCVLHEDFPLNHRPQVIGGVLAQEARKLMTEFFRARRQGPKT